MTGRPNRNVAPPYLAIYYLPSYTNFKAFFDVFDNSYAVKMHESS